MGQDRNKAAAVTTTYREAVRRAATDYVSTMPGPDEQAIAVASIRLGGELTRAVSVMQENTARLFHDRANRAVATMDTGDRELWNAIQSIASTQGARAARDHLMRNSAPGSARQARCGAAYNDLLLSKILSNEPHSVGYRAEDAFDNEEYELIKNAADGKLFSQALEVAANDPRRASQMLRTVPLEFQAAMKGAIDLYHLQQEMQGARRGAPGLINPGLAGVSSSTMRDWIRQAANGARGTQAPTRKSWWVGTETNQQGRANGRAGDGHRKESSNWWDESARGANSEADREAAARAAAEEAMRQEQERSAKAARDAAEAARKAEAAARERAARKAREEAAACAREAEQAAQRNDGAEKAARIAHEQEESRQYTVAERSVAMTAAEKQFVELQMSARSPAHKAVAELLKSHSKEEIIGVLKTIHLERARLGDGFNAKRLYLAFQRQAMHNDSAMFHRMRASVASYLTRGQSRARGVEL